MSRNRRSLRFSRAAFCRACMSLALACAVTYALTVARIPGRITLIEGTARDLRVSWPLRLDSSLADADLIRVDTSGDPSGADVRIVSLGRGETMLDVRLLDVVSIKRLLVDVVPEARVIPGGHAIGVLLSSRGVVVVGHYPVVGPDGRRHYPARDAGIQVGDIIVSINGTAVGGRAEVEKVIDSAARSGDPVEVKIVRDSRSLVVRVRPVRDSAPSGTPGTEGHFGASSYRIGVWVRENAAGVGTLSFYDPRTLRYCALGHVIVDAATNREVDVTHGRIVHAQILGVHQGSRGQPGEKVGTFGGEADVLGTIERNTRFGIFGTLASLPENPHFAQAIPVALADQVTPGPADLYTVVEDDRVERFAVEIQRVNRQPAPQVKSLVVKITDERLLSLTGGIVQGMSGSPIVKDGMLVGVLTHVFVSDQTRGYGVLAEWLAREAGLFTVAETPLSAEAS